MGNQIALWQLEFNVFIGREKMHLLNVEIYTYVCYFTASVADMYMQIHLWLKWIKWRTVLFFCSLSQVWSLSVHASLRFLPNTDRCVCVLLWSVCRSGSGRAGDRETTRHDRLHELRQWTETEVFEVLHTKTRGQVNCSPGPSVSLITSLC